MHSVTANSSLRLPTAPPRPPLNCGSSRIRTAANSATPTIGVSSPSAMTRVGSGSHMVAQSMHSKLREAITCAHIAS